LISVKVNGNLKSFFGLPIVPA